MPNDEMIGREKMLELLTDGTRRSAYGRALLARKLDVARVGVKMLREIQDGRAHEIDDRDLRVATFVLSSVLESLASLLDSTHAYLVPGTTHSNFYKFRKWIEDALRAHAHDPEAWKLISDARGEMTRAFDGVARFAFPVAGASNETFSVRELWNTMKHCHYGTLVAHWIDDSPCLRLGHLCDDVVGMAEGWLAVVSAWLHAVPALPDSSA